MIALAVRWYVRYRLSYADVVEWFAERGLVVNRSTIYRWVKRFLPLFGEAARVHRRPVGSNWRVDETYTRLNGKWTYIYRAIDQNGQVVDAYFSKRRNAEAAEGFFRRAIDETGMKPERVTTDKAKCYPPALRAVLPGVEHRKSKYLNNGIERNHGHSNNVSIPYEASSKKCLPTSSFVGMPSSATCGMASQRSQLRSRSISGLPLLGHSWHGRSSPAAWVLARCPRTCSLPLARRHPMFPIAHAAAT